MSSRPPPAPISTPTDPRPPRPTPAHPARRHFTPFALQFRWAGPPKLQRKREWGRRGGRYGASVFEFSPVELVGYLASALVVFSLTMTSVVRLRILSLLGSITFLTYGILIESAPIILTNSAILVINTWFLRKEFASGTPAGVDLGVSPIRADSPFLADFVTFHLVDIHRFQPDFHLPTGDDIVTLLLNRDGLPAGLLIGRRDGDTLTIDLDYVLSPYRDSHLGRWLYGPGAAVFRKLGFTELRSAGDTDTHRKYLQRVGFHPSATDSDLYELTL